VATSSRGVPGLKLVINEEPIQHLVPAVPASNPGPSGKYQNQNNFDSKAQNIIFR
jgi:hypothetical protein